jgi:hypothetical protein
MGADAALLLEHRIQPTLEGLTAFLSQLKAELVEMKKAEALVAQLGDGNFRVRETATQRLIETPSLPLKALQQATAAADPEVSARAKRILSHSQVAPKVAIFETRPALCAAVFQTIQGKEIRGVTAALFDAIPYLDDPDLLDAACEAVAESAVPEDAALLRRNLEGESLNLKIAAIRGFARHVKEAEKELRALLDDGELRVAMAAAHSLAQCGNRDALSALVRLAGCKDERVRARSEQILRAWTGRNFGFDPFQDPATQQESLARWRTWLDAEGTVSKLNLPLRLALLPEDLRRGLLLHYSFDQTVDGRLTDQSGHRRHGKLHHEHLLVHGVAGKALEVRGAGEMGDQGGHVSVPFIDFTALKQFTVALWVYERGMTKDEGEAYIVFGADRMVGLEDSLGISHFNSGIVYRVGGAVVHVPFAKADQNRWVHYALTFQGGRLRAYKAGRHVGEAKGRVEVVGKQAALGRHWWHHGAATSTRFIGAFDELRIYERALSPGQIERLHASPARTKVPEK